MYRSETLTKFAPAFLKAQSDITVALKDANNPFYKSKYADLSAIIDAVKPHLNKHGITYLQFGVIEGGLETMLLHESGEWVSGVLPFSSDKIIGKDGTFDPQKAGSIISYFKRYGLQAAVGLPTADDDGEAAMGRGGSKQQQSQKTEPKKQIISQALKTNNDDDMFS